MTPPCPAGSTALYRPAVPASAPSQSDAVSGRWYRSVPASGTGLCSRPVWRCVRQVVPLCTGQRYRPLQPPSLTLGLGGGGTEGLTGISPARRPASAPLTETVERGTVPLKIQVNDPMCGVAPQQYRQPETGATAGQPGSRPPLRIVGGLPAEVGRFPWLVSLQNTSQDNRYQWVS